MLDDRAEGAEAAVGLKRNGRDAAAAVVGDEQGLAGGVDGEVARAGAAGGLLVEEGERAGGRVDGVGGEAGGGRALGVAAFVEGVEEFAVGMEGEKRGVFGGGGKLGGRETARSDIEARAVDALAFGFRVGVGAKVDVLGLGRGGERGEHGEEDGEGGGEAVGHGNYWGPEMFSHETHELHERRRGV